MKLYKERHYPWILGFLGPAVVLLLWAAEFSPESSQVEHALSGASGLGAIISGFLATAMAILFALPNSATVRFLKEKNGLTKIVGYLEAAIVWWLLTTIGSLAALFFLPNIRHHHYLLPVGLGWSYLMLASILAFHRASWITARLMRLLASSEDE